MTVSGCGKIGFATRAEANTAVRNWKKQRGVGNMRAYQCDKTDCAKWHLTTGPKTGRAKGGKRHGRNK